MATAMRTAAKVSREIEARTKPAPKPEKLAATKASAARVKTAKTTVTAYVEEELSLRAIECLPEMLQVRAKLDKEWCKQYAADKAAGATFPPIIIFRLPNGRLVVTDGYHRVDAWKALGLQTIRCQVREGTMQDALLAAIEANTAKYHRGRLFGKDDRKHAVNMLLADPVCRKWADQRIAKHCGLSSETVTRHRAAFNVKNGLSAPEFVVGLDGRTRRYKKKQGIVPALQVSQRDKCRARIGDKLIYLGMDESAAASKLDTILDNIEADRKRMRASFVCGSFFPQRNLSFAPITHRLGPNCGLRGHSGHGVVLTYARFDQDDTADSAYGRLHALRELAGMPGARLVCLCVPLDARTRLFDLYRKLGVEFLSPEEFADSLQANSDNRLENLRWDTPSANNIDKYLHGTEQVRSRPGRAKLTEGDIPEIFRLSAIGHTAKQIAAAHGVSTGVIGKVLLRKLWSHAPVPEDLVAASQRSRTKRRYMHGLLEHACDELADSLKGA